MTKEVSKIQLAMQISRNTIVGNILLTAFKLFAGLFSGSAAMVSDAVHSASDVVSTVMVAVSIKLAGKESDRTHQYGHERFECVAAIVLAALLFAIGAGIGFGGAKTILSGEYGGLAVPGRLALVAALASIVVKEAMYWYTRSAAKRIASGAMMADAWHHRSDALSSIGSFAGILGARLGFRVLDSAACLVICIFVLKVAWDIFGEAVGKMTDRSCDDETVGKINEAILRQEGVLGVDQLRTRLFGDKIYVDVEISADGDVPLHQSHDTAHRVHDAVEEQFPRVKHCMVHVNPCAPQSSCRSRKKAPSSLN